MSDANTPSPGNLGYLGNADPTTTGDQFNALAFIAKQVLSGAWTITLAQVESVTNTGEVKAPGTVNLQPLVNEVDGQGNATPHAGMEHMWADLKSMLSQPAIVTGHSLGAARAAVLSALMMVDGVPPVARVVFGEPKPGLLDFAKLIAGIPGRSYRNGDDTHHDLITDVPFSFPPMQYVHPTPIIPVCCRPGDSEFADLGVFAWHHVQLYLAALAAIQPQEKIA